MKMRRMGYLQLKRWLSFLPAAFVVYILLHYFVYQPDTQDAHSAFLGSSSSRRIVKLSASDPIKIIKVVPVPEREQPGEEVTFSPGVVGLLTNRDTLPLSIKEEYVKRNLNDYSESKNGLALTKIIKTANLSSQNVLFDGHDIARTIVDVRRNDKNTIGVVSIPQDSNNEDESLFAHSNSINDHVVKSFQRKRALELKSMLVKRRESKVATNLSEDSGSMKSILEATVDNGYSVVKDTADEPIVETVYDLLPAKRSALDLSARNVPVSPEINSDTNVGVSPLEDLIIKHPLNDRHQTVDTGARKLSLTAIQYDTRHKNYIGGETADIGLMKGTVKKFPTEQDSIIVARVLLSREDNNMKKIDELSTSIEEKEKSPTIEEIRKGIPEGSGISVAANFNSSQLLNSLVVISQNEKSQLRPIAKIVEELNSTAEKLVSNLKSNGSRENKSRQPSTKKIEPTSTKSEAPSSHASSAVAASLPVQPKSSSFKPGPKVATAVKAKTTLHKKTDPPGYAIKALKGPVSVGQRYEKGFATAHEDLCPNNGRDLKVLILITTAPDHEKHRNAVRQTWGHFSMRRDIAMAFVVGRTARTDVQNVIDKENDRYGDIIEANFVDHYSNLTLKTVAMFEWTKTYCSEARFILKTDDDMYINVPLLLAFIIAKNSEKRAMFGRMAKGWKPVRNAKSKYYIDTATYSRVRYPDFLTGPAYLFTNDVVEEMYLTILNTTFFVLEDVLITGIVGESLGVKRVGDSHFRNEKIKLADTCKLMQSISIHMVKYEEQFDIYKRTLDGKTKCNKTR